MCQCGHHAYVLAPSLLGSSLFMFWVYCFLTYISVRMVDESIETARDMLSYCRLIIREAFRHNGEGWREYDCTFGHRWQLTLPFPGTAFGQSFKQQHFWDSINSLFPTCLAVLAPSTNGLSLTSPVCAPSVTQRRPKTLSRVCSSWNSGACRYPGTCNFRHICATCQLGPHRARDCIHTPEDSTYKRPIPRQNPLPPPARTGGLQGQ